MEKVWKWLGVCAVLLAMVTGCGTDDFTVPDKTAVSSYLGIGWCMGHEGTSVVCYARCKTCLELYPVGHYCKTWDEDPDNYWSACYGSQWNYCVEAADLITDDPEVEDQWDYCWPKRNDGIMGKSRE